MSKTATRLVATKADRAEHRIEMQTQRVLNLVALRERIVGGKPVTIGDEMLLGAPVSLERVTTEIARLTVSI